MIRGRFYRRKEWLRLRKQVLFDAGYRCHACGIDLQSLPAKQRHVHHRKKLDDAPALALEPLNLRALCLDCHNREHGRGTLGVAVDGAPLDPQHPWNQEQP